MPFERSGGAILFHKEKGFLLLKYGWGHWGFVKGNIEEGGSVDLSVRTTSTEMRFDCTVTSVEPNHELAWKFHVIHPFLFRGEHIFRIERINDETVKFIDRENFKGPLVLLRGKYLDTEVKEGMIVMDEALKQKVEQQRRS